MPCLVHGKDLRAEIADYGVDKVCMELQESLEKRELRPEDFSLADLFINLHDDGNELFNSISMRKSGKRKMTEAAGAVDSSTFASITGQLFYNKMLEGYMNPALLWPELFTNIDTNILGPERLPGVGGIGDVIEVVDEGAQYPRVGLNEEYVDLPSLQKFGCIVPITREAIIADQTGLVLKRAAESAFHYIGIHLEKNALNIALGQTNTYKRNGVSTNTYLTSGAYANGQTGNALVSWRSLESQELLFDAITDPNTGEPMVVAGEMALIVPTALKMTALRIIDVTEVGAVDNQANASTVRQYGPQPLRNGAMVHATGVKVLSNAYVKKQSSSSTKWWYGQPKKAFVKRTAWQLEQEQAVNNGYEMFNFDIWMQHKATTMTQFSVENPRYMTQSDQ
jgi:hypothetical protein